MKCPFCSHENTRVIDSRPAEDNNSIRRRRVCDECGKRFTTYEKIETIPLIIIKKDNNREAYDRAKIEAQINEHTRAIVCTNPGNPTGVVLTPDEQRLMCDIAKEHGLFIIGDEAYREFV